MPLAKPSPIETSRLQVRQVREDALSALLGINGDPEVTKFLPYPTWNSLTDGQAWFKRMQIIQEGGAALQFVVIDKHTGQPVGTCLLFRHDEGSARAELGYVLARACWGRGYMHEALGALVASAFTTMGLRRLEAEVDPRNAASGRLLQRLGFVREGLLRERWVDKGEAHDVEAYGLLQREWSGSTEGVPR